MTNDIKQFIEKNIDLIESEAWDDLYDEANDWLADRSITELTNILTTTLGIDAEKFAKENVMKHLALELMNLKAEKKITNIAFHSFVMNFMQTINGLDFDELQQMASDYIKGDKDLTVKFDGQGDMYIHKVIVI